jgi:hypothetical protein
MEEWKTILEFPEYQVSNLGRVKRVVASQGAVTGRILKPFDSNGYKKVCLTSGSKKRKVAIHRLVLETFVGMPSEKLDCCHWNGIRSDNRIENLRWASRSENMKDAKRHGTATIGEKNGQAILNSSDVLKIRELRKSGAKVIDMARMYNVTHQAISDICNRRNWRHI